MLKVYLGKIFSGQIFAPGGSMPLGDLSARVSPESQGRQGRLSFFVPYHCVRVSGQPDAVLLVVVGDNTYIFCTPGDKADLFRAVDQKTAVPLIPEFQDYVLSELTRRKILRLIRSATVTPKVFR